MEEDLKEISNKIQKFIDKYEIVDEISLYLYESLDGKRKVELCLNIKGE